MRDIASENSTVPASGDLDDRCARYLWPRSLAVMTLLVMVPASSAVGQIQAHRSVGLSSAPALFACDGSQVASAQKKKSRGKWMMIGGAAGSLLYYMALRGDARSGDGISGSTAVIGWAGWAVGAFGAYQYFTAAPKPEAWDAAVQTIRPNRTTVAEAVRCLGKPQATSSDGRTETLTFAASRPGFMFGGGSYRSVSLTVRNGVVTGVQKTAAGL